MQDTQPGHDLHAGQVEEDFGRGEPFPLLEYLQILWFRRKLIIALTAFVAIAGFIHVNQIPSIYTAYSTLMIGVPEIRVVDIEQVLTRDFSWGDEAVGEIEVIRSRGLAQKVIEKLNLLSHAEFNPAMGVPEKRFFDFLAYLNPRRWIPAQWKQSLRESIRGEVEVVELSEAERERRLMAAAIDRFLGRLEAERVEYSNVLTIRFSSLSPVLAARVANEVPEAYILDQLQAKFEATRKATDWLTEQLAELETKVADSERAVELYREEHGLTKGEQSAVLAAQLSELNSQLITVKAQRAELEVRLEQINRLLASDSPRIETAAEVLASPLVQQLRNQEAEVLARASELSVEYGPKHPRMLQVNAEVNEIQQRINDEFKKIALGLENELELARTREASLEENLGEAERQAGLKSREAIQLRALEREAAANRALFETFLNRFKETSSTQGMETSDSRVISPAEVPRGASYPNRNRMLSVIAMTGFLGACALVFALHLLNPGLLSPEQIEKEYGVHAIGMLPRLPSGTKPHQHLLDKRTSAYVEALNSLKISLQLSDPDAKIKAIQITSSVPEEGKSSLALSLAMVLSQAGRKVLLIDADLRRSHLEETLGLAVDHPGLTDLVLAADGDPGDFIVKVEKFGIDFMRSGDAGYANATDIFSSRRMEAIVAGLRAKYDYILLDTPPVMAVADARVIGKLADKTLFVVRWDKTPRKVVRAALDLLRKGGSDITGAVLQQVDLRRYGRLGYGDSGYYYHYGRYGQYYQG